MRILFHAIAPVLIAASLSGCAVLLGTVKPVDEKSEQYGVMDLSKYNPDWMKLDASDAEAEGERLDEGEKTEVSDVAFQHSKNASIISLNSACRASIATSGQDLKSLTNLLLLGISEITLRDEKELTVQGSPALQTTVRGKLNQESMMLRTVIVRRTNCVYDLMFVSRPRFFVENEADFSNFVSSLRLK